MFCISIGFVADPGEYLFKKGFAHRCNLLSLSSFKDKVRVKEVVSNTYKRQEIVLFFVIGKKVQVIAQRDITTSHQCIEIILKTPPILWQEIFAEDSFAKFLEVIFFAVLDSVESTLSIIYFVRNSVTADINMRALICHKGCYLLRITTFIKYFNANRYDPCLVRFIGQVGEPPLCKHKFIHNSLLDAQAYLCFLK